MPHRICSMRTTAHFVNLTHPPSQHHFDVHLNGEPIYKRVVHCKRGLCFTMISLCCKTIFNVGAKSHRGTATEAHTYR